jgi:hypothetical protein
MGVVGEEGGRWGGGVLVLCCEDRANLRMGGHRSSWSSACSCAKNSLTKIKQPRPGSSPMIGRVRHVSFSKAGGILLAPQSNTS